MRMRPLSIVFPVLLILFAAPLPSSAAQPQGKGQATAVITAFHETLLSVMKQAQELGIQGRYDLLAPAVDRAFHLNLTARQAAGRKPWKGAAPDDQKALLDAFRHWTIATYANQFNGWSGQEFINQGESPGPQKGTVLVKTELTGNEPVTLTYLMVFSDDRWGVYDVLVRQGTTSISQLAKHISEFKSIAKNGLPALTETLAAKSKDLLTP